MSDTNSEFRPESGEDWWAVGELFSLAVDQLSAPVEGMHRAIADRWLGLAGESADPVRRGYDTVTKTVYSAVRIGGRALGAVVPMMASLIGRKHTASEQPGSHITSGLRAWANGLWGDELEERGSKLAVPMSFCDAGGTQVDPTPFSTAKAFPNPTGDVVVLLHGLGESERSWHSRTDVHPDLADVLAAESLVPVFVRYNTGDAMSRTTVHSWQTCSTNWNQAGPCPFTGSASSATQWAASSPAAPLRPAVPPAMAGRHGLRTS